MASPHCRAHVVLLLALATAITGCGADSADDDADTSGSAIEGERVLDGSRCGPDKLELTKNAPPPGRPPVAGTFDGTMKGCVLSRNGKTGAELIARAMTIVSDKAAFAGLEKPSSGNPLFSKFKPGKVSGSITGPDGMWFETEIAIDLTIDAKGTLKVTAKKHPNGDLSVHIVNTSPIGALLITAIEKDELDIMVTLSPATNGVEVGGHAKVRLRKFESKIDVVSRIGPQIVDWLEKRIADVG